MFGACKGQAFSAAAEAGRCRPRHLCTRWVKWRGWGARPRSRIAGRGAASAGRDRGKGRSYLLAGGGIKMPTRWIEYDDLAYFETLEELGATGVIEVVPYLGGRA